MSGQIPAVSVQARQWVQTDHNSFRTDDARIQIDSESHGTVVMEVHGFHSQCPQQIRNNRKQEAGESLIAVTSDCC